MAQPGAQAPDTRFGFEQVYLGGEALKWLYVMKGRLHIGEGPIVRLAICLSLGESSAPDPSLLDQEGGKLFSVASLAGPPTISQLLFAFLRQRMFDDGLDPLDEAELERQFRAHLARGLLTLGVRVKHLADVGRLVQDAQERFRQSHPELDGDELDAGAEGAVEREPAGAQVGDLLPETGGQVGREPAAPAAEPPADGAAPLPTMAGSLWGALLPPPGNVAGASRSARKRRGVPSTPKKRRRRR